MRFEVLHYTLCDGWINAGHGYDEFDNPIPLTYGSFEEAWDDLVDDFDEWQHQIDTGERPADEGYDSAEFMIAPVGEKGDNLVDFEYEPGVSHAIETIWLRRAEGSTNLDPVTFTSMKEAQQWIDHQSYTVDGQYDKVDCKVTWNDGSEYAANLRIVNSAQQMCTQGNSIVTHIMTHANYLLENPGKFKTELVKLRFLLKMKRGVYQL